MKQITKDECLIVTDMQNDFCPGGALAVPEGDALVGPINRLMRYFPLVVGTQDWHPPNHCSFKGQGGPWPPHCVQNTWGADFHPKLDSKKFGLIIHKAQYQNRDAYSAFQETPLAAELRKRKIKKIYLTGLATDYCIKNTALDGLRRHLETVIFIDLVRAVNAGPGDGGRALREIENAGGKLIDANEWCRRMEKAA